MHLRQNFRQRHHGCAGGEEGKVVDGLNVGGDPESSGGGNANHGADGRCGGALTRVAGAGFPKLKVTLHFFFWVRINTKIRKVMILPLFPSPSIHHRTLSRPFSPLQFRNPSSVPL